MPGSLTPWLTEGLVRTATSLPFGEARRLLAHFTGTTVAEATARSWLGLTMSPPD